MEEKATGSQLESSEYVLPVHNQDDAGRSALWTINEAVAKANTESGERHASIHVAKGEYALEFGELCIDENYLSIFGEVGANGEVLTSVVGRVRIAGAKNVLLQDLVVTSTGAGICIDGGATCVLRNCHIVGCGATG